MNTLQDIIAEHNRLTKQIEALRANAKPKIEASLVETLKEEISKIDGLSAVKWTQYIPSFNDGDVCSFTLGEIEFCFGDDDWVSVYEDECLHKRACKQIEKLIRGIPEDLLESTFGWGVSIEVNKDGKITVDDFDGGY